MVIIDQKSFNDDMGRYLNKIRSPKPTSFKDRINIFKTSDDEEVPELSETQVHVEYKKPSVFRKIFRWKRRTKLDEVEEDLTDEEKAKLEVMESEIEAIEEEESNIEEMEEELEEKKQPLLAAMFDKINFFRKKHEDEYVDDFEVEKIEEKPDNFNEDIKDVLKITHTWLEKLPVRYKKMFKDSDDFARYKEVLIKYGLVREKGALEAHPEPVIKEVKEEIVVKEKPKKTSKKTDKKKKK